HRCDGTRSHREDVTKNSTHARRGALERLDIRRMIGRFDFESNGKTAADIDDARVFTGTLEDCRAFCGKPFQVDARTLVAAVLAPHHAEDAQFGPCGLALENLHNA